MMLGLLQRNVRLVRRDRYFFQFSSRNIGAKHIGFINPVVCWLRHRLSSHQINMLQIYSKTFARAFNDITTGGNQGCGRCISLCSLYTAVLTISKQSPGTPGFTSYVYSYLSAVTMILILSYRTVGWDPVTGIHVLSSRFSGQHR